MSHLNSNYNFVFPFLETRFLFSLYKLSMQTSKIILKICRGRLIKVKELKQFLKTTLATNNFVFFPKDSELVFNNISKKDPLTTLKLSTKDDISSWISTVGVDCDDCKFVSQFSRIETNWLLHIKNKVHFETGDDLTYKDNCPSNVTFGSVSRLTLFTVPKEAVPIRNVHSVKEVYFKPAVDYDLTFLEQFPRLLRFEVNKPASCTIIPLSLTAPSLVYLDELVMFETKAIVNTTNLRILNLRNLTIDETLIKLIGRQSRLIKFEIWQVKNAIAIKFLPTIKSLIWRDSKDQQDEQSYAEHLRNQVMSLNLRDIRTDVELKTIDWLNVKKIDTWAFNGLISRRHGNERVLQISDRFNVTLPYLNKKAEKGLVYVEEVSSLNLIEKETSKLFLFMELKGDFEEVHVMENVKELKMFFRVNQNQAQRMARIFPQFTVVELMKKGLQ